MRSAGVWLVQRREQRGRVGGDDQDERWRAGALGWTRWRALISLRALSCAARSS
jgi:hypothetical protein